MFGISSWLLLILSTSAVDMETPSSSLVITSEQQQETTQESTKPDKIESPVTAAPSIIITNAIEPTMLEYKHWTGKYTPDIFTLSINNTPVCPGETYTLESVDTPLTVHIDYSFKNGYRKGSKTISYKLNKDVTQATLTFSWVDPCKVIIDNATLVTEEITA